MKTPVNPAAFDIIPAASFPSVNLTMLAPASGLEPWVQCLWMTTGNTLSAPYLEEKLYPDAGASLTFAIGTTGVSAAYFHNTRTCRHRWDMALDLISIRLRPGAAWSLLKLAVSELQDTDTNILELKPFWLSGYQRLLDALPNKPTFQQVALIQQWLLSLRPSAQTPDQRLFMLMAEVNANLASPLDLAADKGLSRRTLERHLRQKFAVSPNQILAYAQIKQARHQLIHSSASLADIALNCGYYDQAHFTNAFHERTFETPAQYRSRKLSQFSNRK